LIFSVIESFQAYHYTESDEKNSESILSVLMKTGGGTLHSGHQGGIHWFMNIANDIEYIALDRQRQDIPWIKVISKETGDTTIYTRYGSTPTADMLNPKKIESSIVLIVIIAPLSFIIILLELLILLYRTT